MEYLCPKLSPIVETILCWPDFLSAAIFSAGILYMYIMKFNVGDKVRFLNESGGGIITRIINPNLVSVAIEDGFDIPTLASNLIRLETLDGEVSDFEEIASAHQSFLKSLSLCKEDINSCLRKKIESFLEI